MVDRVRETETYGNGPSQDLHDEVLAEFTELKTAAQRIAQKIKTALGRYEAAGGVSEEIKFSHKLGKLEKGEAQSLVRRLNRAARWSGVITWDEQTGQSDFAATFDQQAEAETAGVGAAPGSRLSRARAYNDGYNSGKAGGTLDGNKFEHAPGSSEYVAWADGCRDGQTDRNEFRATQPENAAEMQAAAEVDTSRKRGRGRPPKGGNGEDAPARGRRRRSEDGVAGHA